MSRIFYLFAIFLLFAGCVYANEIQNEDEAPVPEGFTLPNIENAVTDNPKSRHQAKVLINMVAKEPRAAKEVEFKMTEDVIEDTWNGEADPEGMASVAQKKMLKEVASLENLIAQGKKILFVLPKKEKRLALLKSKLSVILDARAKAEAAEKLDQQEALLAAIKKRESAMSTRLNALKSSQNKLQANVGKLKSVIRGKPAAKITAKKARFQQTETETETEGEADAETEESE